MRQALRLASRALGETSPNPMVGAVLVKHGRVIGQGWHHRAGDPHAEIEALRDAQSKGESGRGATLFVTLEPCSTEGRTPPCTRAIVDAGIRRVVIGATDPNPSHAGRGFTVLRKAKVLVQPGLLAEEATRLNESFNHWIVHRTPFVTVKAAMTLDGKIATPAGESKWITGPEARAEGMRLRARADAILAGVNTILRDDPALTLRDERTMKPIVRTPPLRRILLDSQARTPLTAQVVSDKFAAHTTVVTSRDAPPRRVQALQRRVNVWQAPERRTGLDLRWILRKLGTESVTHLLVEGGGEVNASFLLGGFAHRVVFFYAPKIIGGANALRGVAGEGVGRLEDVIDLTEVEWSRVGPDLMLRALVKAR